MPKTEAPITDARGGSRRVARTGPLGFVVAAAAASVVPAAASTIVSAGCTPGDSARPAPMTQACGDRSAYLRASVSEPAHLDSWASLRSASTRRNMDSIGARAASSVRETVLEPADRDARFLAIAAPDQPRAIVRPTPLLLPSGWHALFRHIGRATYHNGIVAVGLSCATARRRSSAMHGSSSETLAAATTSGLRSPISH